MENKEIAQTPPKAREISFPLALILIGLIFLVGKIFAAVQLPWLWPAVVLAIGLILLIRAFMAKEGGAGRWFSPLLLFLFGLVYLLGALNVFKVDMEWIWPSFLVVIGIAILLRDRR